MAGVPALRPLDDRQAKFVGLFVEGGDPVRAALEAGYSQSIANHARTHLLASAHIAWAVAVESRKRLARLVPTAIGTLEHLAREAESEKVRHDAAKTLLDRAGFIAPRAAAEKKTDDKPLHERSTAELQELAQRLEEEIAGRAKPVSGVELAPKDSQAVDLVG